MQVVKWMDRSRQIQNKRPAGPIGANGQGGPTGPPMQRAQMGQQQVYQPQQLQGWSQPAQPQMQAWPAQQQSGGYVQAPQQYAPPQQQLPQQQPQQVYVQQPQPAPQAMYNGAGTQQRPYGAPQTSTSQSFGGPNQYLLQQPAAQIGYAPPGQVPSVTTFRPTLDCYEGVLQSLLFTRASGLGS